MTGRYFVVVDADGYGMCVATHRQDAERHTGPNETVVECIAMPRVRVVSDWTVCRVTVNGVSVLTTEHEETAKHLARDLRRALRGK